MAYARSRRLSAERRHHPLQRAQRGFLGQARQGTLLAVPAGRDQAWGNAGAGDVPRTAGRSGPPAQPREDPGADAQLAALRGARALAQTGLARQLPGAEADLVPAAAGRARVRCAPACFGAPRIRCLALERLLDTPRLRDRFQARRLPARAHGACPLSVSRPGPQASSRGSRITLTARRFGPLRRNVVTSCKQPLLPGPVAEIERCSGTFDSRLTAGVVDIILGLLLRVSLIHPSTRRHPCSSKARRPTAISKRHLQGNHRQTVATSTLQRKRTLKGKTTSRRCSALPPRAKPVTPTAISNTWSSAAIRRRTYRSAARA